MCFISAVTMYNVSIIRWLLERGASVHVRDVHSYTPLVSAVRAGHLAIALHHARSQSIDTPQNTLELSHHLLKANLCKHYPMHQTIPPHDLQSLFLSLSVQDISLALASPTNILYPSVRVSNLLLLAGADPNIRVSDSDIILDQESGDTSLLSVHSSLGHSDMVSLLLEWGADVDAINDSGVTSIIFLK